MRTCLLVALGVLFASSVAFGQYLGDPEPNDTPNATCERIDPLDEYIYHAPRLDNIVIDGDYSDWDQYPLLEWTRVGNCGQGIGQEPWSAWNDAPTGPDDLDCEFKAGWGEIGVWPVLYLLVKTHDDNFMPGTDQIEFYLSEWFYDYYSEDLPFEGHIAVGNHDESGLVYDYHCRAYRAQLDGDGFLMFDALAGAMVPVLEVEHGESQFYSVGQYELLDDAAYMECSIQLYADYFNGIAWDVVPGQTCLGFFVRAYDYDADEYSLWTWGWHNWAEDGGWIPDRRGMFSTIGFERSYAELFEGTAVQSSTWGAIKSAF